MRSKSRIALSALIRRYQPSESEQLLSLLPASAEKFDWIGADGADAFTTSISQRLRRIHYSWLAELIRKQPAELQPYWVGGLPSDLVHGVASFLHIEPKESPATLHRFFQQQLYLALDCDEILPEELLPPSPLNRLLNLDKKELVRFISLLGVRDLAMRLKKVVARETIVHFQRLLSETRYRYLVDSMRLQDPFPTPQWELSEWRGTARELEHLLQGRGVMRLGVALKEESPSLVWHLIRRLDTGRGNQVKVEWQAVWERAVRRSASRQVMELLEP